MTTLRSRKVHRLRCSPCPHLDFRSGCVHLEQAIAYGSRGGHRKISDILVDAKLPRSERSSLLLLGHEQEPLWLLGLRLAVQAPPLRDLCYVKVVAEWVTAPSEEKNQSPSRTIAP